MAEALISVFAKFRLNKIKTKEMNKSKIKNKKEKNKRIEIGNSFYYQKGRRIFVSALNKLKIVHTLIVPRSIGFFITSK